MDNSLFNRMKTYEDVFNMFLMRRVPVIIRLQLDGKAFHQFTRGFVRPYDDILKQCMLNTTKRLCENIQGCVLGYTQSDEISLLLEDYEKITTDAWFGYRIQKIASVSASMATLYFNKAFNGAVCNGFYECCEETLGDEISKTMMDRWNQLDKYYKPKLDTAIFDSRVFNLPKEEVCNYFIWRQQDATRNSILLLGQSRFSHKQLNKKSCSDIQDMLMEEYRINWNNVETKYKRGSCVIKKDERWIIDNEIPIFTQDREYIERLIQLYCGYVTKITNVRKHSNADRLLIGECFGNSVVVSIDTDVNSLGVYFPIDGTLSKEFAEANNLCRKKDENGNNIGGFLDPDKRNITALKLRGEKSEGLWLPIKCLEAFCDVSKLKEGEKITTINGKLICEKYIPRSQTRVFEETPKSTKTKKSKTTVKYPLFMEHADTEQLAYNLERFKPGDTCYITLKCHGSSGRTSNSFKITSKKTLVDKIFGRPGKQVNDWDYISGSRRVVLPVIDGYNKFREKYHEFFKGKLNKGEEVYYEIVGYDHNGRPIMPDGDNTKIRDKEFIKQYGKTTRFSYGCELGESDCYVYRMTMTNEDGDIVEYPWEYVKYRCEQMGAKTVPELDKFLYTNQEDLKQRVNHYKEGSDPIGKTHTREGVVVRIDNRPSFTAFKEKAFAFNVLEGLIKDEATEPDMEEAQE